MEKKSHKNAILNRNSPILNYFKILDEVEEVLSNATTMSKISFGRYRGLLSQLLKKNCEFSYFLHTNIIGH